MFVPLVIWLQINIINTEGQYDKHNNNRKIKLLNNVENVQFDIIYEKTFCFLQNKRILTQA